MLVAERNVCLSGLKTNFTVAELAVNIVQGLAKK